MNKIIFFLDSETNGFDSQVSYSLDTLDFNQLLNSTLDLNRSQANHLRWFDSQARHSGQALDLNHSQANHLRWFGTQAIH